MKSSGICLSLLGLSLDVCHNMIFEKLLLLIKENSKSVSLPSSLSLSGSFLASQWLTKALLLDHGLFSDCWKLLFTNMLAVRCLAVAWGGMWEVVNNKGFYPWTVSSNHQLKFRGRRVAEIMCNYSCQNYSKYFQSHFGDAFLHSFLYLAIWNISKETWWEYFLEMASILKNKNK